MRYKIQILYQIRKDRNQGWFTANMSRDVYVQEQEQQNAGYMVEGELQTHMKGWSAWLTKNSLQLFFYFYFFCSIATYTLTYL